MVLVCFEEDVMVSECINKFLIVGLPVTVQKVMKGNVDFFEGLNCNTLMVWLLLSF